MQKRHTTPATTSSRTADRQTGEMRDEIIDWLRDAYAMERSLESTLEKQSKNQDLSSTVRDRATRHLEETRRHAEDVKFALQSLDTDTSGLKTGMGVLAQASKGMVTKFARDEEIKDLLDAYAMEHFEIACYTALAAAAEQAGLAQVTKICQRIIPDEERMAQALMRSLPGEVVNYMHETKEAEGGGR
jgi:ferritin-like metal-binding protein YciE